MKRKGFTLIELLVVIAIIALLLAIAMPGLRKAKQYARTTVCLSNIHGTMLSVAAYSASNDDFLPRSGRSWPHEGTIDYPTMLISAGLEPTNLHCPGDRHDPGAIAVWWEDTIGREFQDSDYLPGYKPEQLGIKTHNDFSYLWSAKLFLECDSPGVPTDGPKWRMTDIRQPARLIVYAHFWSLVDLLEGNIEVPHGKLGYSAGFLDGHSEFVMLKDMKNRVEPVHSNTRAFITPYADQFTPEEVDALSRWNPDWNPNGVKGADF